MGDMIALRPTHEPWTPERVIDQQRESIASWRQRAQSAEKLASALSAYAGRQTWLLEAAIASLDEIADERDRALAAAQYLHGFV